MFRTPVGTPALKRQRSSDSDSSVKSNGSDSSTDANDLTIVAEFDELMRLMKLKRNDEVEDQLLAYALFTQAIFERLDQREKECISIQNELENKIQTITELEHKLTSARKMLDKEKKNTRKALHEKNAVEFQLEKVKEILLKDKRTFLPDETREKLSFLNCYRRDTEERAYPDLSAIPEGHTTGSLLSEFSYSQSGGDDLMDDSSDWGKNEPAIKKRRSSNKIVEIGPSDKVRATTTVTMQKEGPITATSIIEAIPSTPGNKCFTNPTTPKGCSNLGQEKVNSNSANILKKHCFLSKITVIPENCAVCDNRVRFGKVACKCKECRAVCHSECRDALPVPCIPTINTPNNKGVGSIGDHAPLTSPMVPAIIVHCVKEVEAKGLTEMGIYRIPGSEREVKLLKEKFLKNRGAPSLSNTDIHVICGTIKDFLKSLREPLIPTAKWSDFVRAAHAENNDDTASQLRDCITSLPRPNRDTIAYLMLHFRKVAQAPECKMPASNLARVFGPTIVGYSSADLTPQMLMDETRQIIKVMDELQNLPVSFWNEFINVPSTPTSNLRQNPSTESLVHAMSKNVFTPSIRRVERRKERIFPSPSTHRNM